MQKAVTKPGPRFSRQICLVAHAYLDLLRLIEQRSLWYELLHARLLLAGDDHVKSPTLSARPEVGDLATISTLMVAFGSDRLRCECSAWLQAEQEFEKAHEITEWNYWENYVGSETPVPGRPELCAVTSRF